MQQELFGLAHKGVVNQLLVVLGAQGQRGQALRLSTGEDGRSVCGWQVIDFAPDGTNVCGTTSIQTNAFVQQQVTNGLLLCALDVVA